ncbi:MAG: RNA ligase partner protein [Candidatus Omnitrophica bacterium]|nr:RNA ligase partner protein [Candidatus Omnitrophota bacterium]
MKKEAVVIDTSTFVNPASYKLFAKTPEEAFINIIDLLKRRAKLYMPPSVMEELANFIDYTKIPPSTLTSVSRKPPRKYEIKLPALFIYELIEEIRARVNKGLRVAEKSVRKTKNLDERDIIQSLRQEYRLALREGIIDSKEDADLIILAKELKAKLLTCDKGLIKWAHKLGIECLLPQNIKPL